MSIDPASFPSHINKGLHLKYDAYHQIQTIRNIRQGCMLVSPQTAHFLIK